MKDLEIQEEKAFYQFFIGVAEFFRSLAAIILFLLCLVVFQIFETQTLFDRILPIDNSTKRLMASILIAIAYEFTQLLFTVNKDKIHKNSPLLIAIASFLINVFFFQAWKDENNIPITNTNADYIIIGFKFFMSALLAYLTYTYAELFLAKWEESNITESLKQLSTIWKKRKQEINTFEQEKEKITTSNETLKQEINTSQQELIAIQKQTEEMDHSLAIKTTLLNTIKTNINNQEQKVNGLEQEANILSIDIEELKESNKKIKEYAKKFQCRKCKKVLSTIQRKEGHEKNCTGKFITEVNNKTI